MVGEHSLTTEQVLKRLAEPDSKKIFCECSDATRRQIIDDSISCYRQYAGKIAANAKGSRLEQLMHIYQQIHDETVYRLVKDGSTRRGDEIVPRFHTFEATL